MTPGRELLHQLCLYDIRELASATWWDLLGPDLSVVVEQCDTYHADVSQGEEVVGEVHRDRLTVGVEHRQSEQQEGGD